MFKVFQVTGTVSFAVDGEVDNDMDDNFVENIIGGSMMPMAALEKRVLDLQREEHNGEYPDDKNKKKKHKITVHAVYIDSVNVIAENVKKMV